MTDCLTDWLNDAFSQNLELLLDKRILGIVTVLRRVTGCACGSVSLMYVSRQILGTGLGRGRGRARRGTEQGQREGSYYWIGCMAHPRHLVNYIKCINNYILYEIKPTGLACRFATQQVGTAEAWMAATLTSHYIVPWWHYMSSASYRGQQQMSLTLYRGLNCIFQNLIQIRAGNCN